MKRPKRVATCFLTRVELHTFVSWVVRVETNNETTETRCNLFFDESGASHLCLLGGPGRDQQ